MELSEILNSLTEASPMEKAASDSSSNLSSAIDKALMTTAQEKTASEAGSPTNDLMKIASDLASAEENALIKEAHIYGVAVCDGFMSRMSQYENNGQMQKQAPHSEPDQNMIKQAMQLGYNNTMSQLQGISTQDHQVKLAQEEAHRDQQVKIAAFTEGYNDTMTKVSAFNEGYTAVMQEAEGLNKTAAAYEDYGFQCGNEILSEVTG